MENMKPESIENRWDILYSKYPEVYDEFAKVERVPNLMDFVFEKFDFAGKKILHGS